MLKIPLYHLVQGVLEGVNGVPCGCLFWSCPWGQMTIHDQTAWTRQTLWRWNIEVAGLQSAQYLHQSIHQVTPVQEGDLPLAFLVGRSQSHSDTKKHLTLWVDLKRPFNSLQSDWRGLCAMQYHVTILIVDSVSWACTNPYRINLIATPLYFPSLIKPLYHKC